MNIKAVNLKYQWSSPGGYREIFRISYPLLLFSVSTVIMQFCDRKFLGNSSTEEIAASLPAGALVISLAVFFISLIVYSNPLTAQYFGAGRKDKCVDVLWTSAWASVLCVGIMAVVMPLLGYLILGLTLKGQSYHYGIQYFMIQIPGQLAQCVAGPFFSFYSGRGKTLVVAGVNIFAAVLNILLDWILIFGHWHFPHLGILGAGLATSISIMTGALIIVLIVLFEPDQNEYATRNWRRLDRDIFKKLFTLGGPSGFQQLSNSFKFTTMILLVGSLGNIALASTTIALSMIMITFMPLYSLSGANVIISGQFIGKDQRRRASLATYRAWYLSLGYTMLSLICFLFFSRPVIWWFAPSVPSPDIPFEAVAHNAWIILLIMGIWMNADTGRYIFGSLLQASGDTKALLFINLVVAWLIGVPAFGILALVIKPPVYFVWMFFIVVSLTEALWIYSRFRGGYWRKIELMTNVDDPYLELNCASD